VAFVSPPEGPRENVSAGIALTSVDALLNWGRGHSLWIMPMGTACCAIEFMATAMSKFDFDRHGTVPFIDPRHSDVMVVAGTITRKMAPAVVRLYEQMPEPKWVVAMGNCAVSGGIFYYDSYSVIRGVDELIPVDIYIAGCPPRPEALEDAFLQLRNKIKTESFVKGVRHTADHELPLLGHRKAAAHHDDAAKTAEPESAEEACS